MLACMALSLAGGMYAPPVRVVRANTSSSFVFLGALSFLSPSPVSPPASLQIRITSKIHVTGSSLIISVTVFLKSFLSGIHVKRNSLHVKRLSFVHCLAFSSLPFPSKTIIAKLYFTKQTAYLGINKF